MQTTQDLYAVVGAGGFGREVMPMVRRMLQARGILQQPIFVAEAVDCASVNGYEVLELERFLSYRGGARRFCIAIADSSVRRRLADRLEAAGAVPFSVQAANTTVMDCNEIGDGAVLCAFTTVTSNARIGRHFHANIYSYIAHDCTIGDFVTFAPRVSCNGRVVIEDDAYIGTGAILREGRPGRPIVIGRGAIVGMGAVVTKSVPPYTTVVGNPATPLVRRKRE